MMFYLFQDCVIGSRVGEICIGAHLYPYYHLLHSETCSIPTELMIHKNDSILPHYSKLYQLFFKLQLFKLFKSFSLIHENHQCPAAKIYMTEEWTRSLMAVFGNSCRLKDQLLQLSSLATWRQQKQDVNHISRGTSLQFLPNEAKILALLLL